jgi:hypothetical protein
MSATQTWIGRLSIPALVSLHVFGAIIGAGLAIVLGAIVLAILQIENDGNVALIAITFFLIGAILPSLLLWRARNQSFRAALLRPDIEPEFIRTVSLALDSNEEDPTVQASTEAPSATTSDQPVRHNARNYLRDVAEYNQALRQAKTQGSSGDQISPENFDDPSDSNNIRNLLKPSSRRWRWWHTLSTALSAIVVIAIFLPPIKIPIEPSFELELTRKDLLLGNDGHVVEIVNVGRKPIKIVSMTINDRADCKIDYISWIETEKNHYPRN